MSRIAFGCGRHCEASGEQFVAISLKTIRRAGISVLALELPGVNSETNALKTSCMRVGSKLVRNQSESLATVEMPAALFSEAGRIASQQSWTVEQPLTYLFSRGIDARHETERTVTEAYNAFINAPEQSRDELGKVLIRSIFGPASVA